MTSDAFCTVLTSIASAKHDRKASFTKNAGYFQERPLCEMSEIWKHGITVSAEGPTDKTKEKELRLC